MTVDESALTNCPRCKSADVALMGHASDEYAVLRGISNAKVYGLCFGCAYSGPKRDTKEEARTAWNRIAVVMSRK